MIDMHRRRLKRDTSRYLNHFHYIGDIVSALLTRKFEVPIISCCTRRLIVAHTGLLVSVFTRKSLEGSPVYGHHWRAGEAIALIANVNWIIDSNAILSCVVKYCLETFCVSQVKYRTYNHSHENSRPGNISLSLSREGKDGRGLFFSEFRNGLEENHQVKR